MKRKLNIKAIKHLCLRLGVSADELLCLSKNKNKFIRKKEITTKEKIRNIYYATKKLRQIHIRIKERLLNTLKIDRAAHGWCKGRSIITNASKHCHKNFYFCLDLKNCFENTTSKAIRAFFEMELGCSPNVSSLLTNLITIDYKVPQGFITSPSLINVFLRDLDYSLNTIAMNYSLEYSRYGDDLTFSGEKIPLSCRRQIIKEIANRNLYLNSKKFIFAQLHNAPTITGLNIKGTHPKIARQYKKYYRSLQHKVSLKQNQTNLLNKLNGMKAFILSVEKFNKSF